MPGCTNACPNCAADLIIESAEPSNGFQGWEECPTCGWDCCVAWDTCAVCERPKPNLTADESTVGELLTCAECLAEDDEQPADAAAA